MFNQKNTAFLGIISMLFVLFFVSACEKAEIYDLNVNNDGGIIEQDSNIKEPDVMESDEKEDTKVLLEKKEEIKQGPNIVFEDLNWKKYSNKLLGYSIDYPTIVNIMGDDLDQHVEFTGPLSNNEWWPRISISHYSNDFYRPGDDISVEEWVKPFPEYKIGDDISIAGLDTVHYVQAKTPQAWAADYFYFIKDNQLYNITIIHSNDKQDWKLYDRILESFSFNYGEQVE